MSVLGWVSNRRGVLAGTAAQVVGLSVVAAVVVTANGYPTDKVDLNDSGVWTVNQDKGMVGRVIAAVGEGDNPVSPSFTQDRSKFDVLQDGRNVVVWNPDASKVAMLEPATSMLAPEVGLPAGAQVAVGAALAAVVDVATGKAWFGPTPQVLASDFTAQDKAPISAGVGATVSIGLDGTLAVASPATSAVGLYRWVNDRVEAGPVSPLPSGPVAQVTVVGAGPRFDDVKPVALMADGRVILPGGEAASVPTEDGPVLQLPGPTSDAVLVATEKQLLSVSLAGASPVELFGGGTGGPVRPVVVGTCGVGAWADRALVAQGCGASQYTGTNAFDGAKAEQLVLRVNHGWVILNDPSNGRTVIADDPTREFLTWKDLSRVDTTPQDILGSAQKKLDPNARVQPIVTKPDQFGVRPGASALMRVLANDQNPNNLVLRVQEESLSPVQPATGGQVTTIEGGKALQFTAADAAAGSARLSYVASDGKAVSAATPVAVTVVTDGTQNTQPKLLSGAPSQRKLDVPVRGTASFAVLDDWFDPEGDPMSLTCDAADSSVRCTPEGTITVRGFGDQTQDFTVKYHVSDGRVGDPGAGALQVHLVPVDGMAPIARPDYAVAVLGRPITLRPLANDTGFGVGSLTLTLPREVTGMVDNGDGTLTFTPTSLGSVVAIYTATSSSKSGGSTLGAIRVDVVRPNPSAKPVASPDDASLRADGSVIVDVLANDFDPAGRPLMATSANQVRAEGVATDTVAAQILDGRLLRITALPGFGSRDSATVRYTVTNGTNEATSSITIRAMPDNVPYAPPLTADDAITVQAGAAVSVPVMSNDSDPEGGVLTLQPLPKSAIGFRKSGLASDQPAEHPTDDGAWAAFANGDMVVLVAPREPGLMLMTYSVLNQHGDSASATLKVTVTAPSDVNTPSAPPPLLARLYIGQKVVIPAAATFDRAGFPVQLADPVSQPTPAELGSVQLGTDGYVFTASTSPGLATFPYQVRTASGVLSPTSTVTVLVAQLPDAQPPVAVPDVVVARPGRAVDVNVLANDYSPTGQPVALESVNPATGARKVGSLVRVTLDTGAATPVRTSYTITSQDSQADGTLSVTPDVKAPLLPLVAQRDEVDAGIEPTVSVRVLDNDANPNGKRDDLKIVSAAPSSVATLQGTSVVVRRGEGDQYAWYSIASTISGDNQPTVQGLIFIPGMAKKPVPIVPQPAVVMKEGGASFNLDITDYAKSLAGRPIRLAVERPIGHTGVSAVAKDTRNVTLTVDSTTGNGVVTLPVTDLPDGPVPDSLIASISVQVTIDRTPPDPVMLVARVTVANDGTPSAGIGLRALLTPPDPNARLAFSSPEGPSELTPTITGSSLVVTASPGMRPGTYKVTYTVARAGAANTGTGVVNVTVTKLQPPTLQRCPAASFADNSAVVLDLAQCIAPSYKDVGRLLFTASSPQAKSVVVNGSKATFTRSDAFLGGQATLAFTVTDAAKNVVSSQWAFAVYGPPGKATNVVATQVPQTAGAATVIWREPANKGGVTVLTYTVEAIPDGGGAGTRVVADSSSSMTVTGLSYTAKYRFVVHAKSDQSPSESVSDPIDPIPPLDITPTVTSVSATPGNRQAVVNWSTDGKGSDIVQAVVTPKPESPSSPAGASCAAPSRTISSPGRDGSITVPVVNGCGYTFSVDVTNQTAKSAQGTSTPPVYPFGPVSGVPTPGAVLGSSGAGKTLNVTWDPVAVYAAANGAIPSATGVTIVVTGASSLDVPAPGNPGSVAVQVPAYGDYSVALRVTNVGGQSAAGAGRAVSAAGTPDPPTVTSATARDRSAQVGYDLGAVNGLGWTSAVVTASPGGATAQGSFSGSSGTATFGSGSLSNGTPYTFTVVACNELKCSAASAPSSVVTPFGSPVAPVVALGTSSGSTGVTVRVTAGSGNGRAGTLSLSISGPGVGNNSCPGSWTISGSAVVDLACSFTGQAGAGYTVTVSLTQATTGTVVSGTASATIPNPPPPPQPSVTISHGQAVNCSTGAAGSGCYKIVVSIRNFTPGVRYSTTLVNREGNWSGSSGNVTLNTTDANGNSDTTSAYWYGFPTGWVGATVSGYYGERRPWGA